MPQQPASQQTSYFVTAFIHSVKIDRGVLFNSKVLWKRKDHKAETQVVQNIDGVTQFQEALVLPLTFVYDKRNKQYLEKKTDLYVVVIAESGLKSGGSVRYDVSKALNEGLSDQKMKIQLLKCPDATGYIEVSFMFEKSDVPFENQSELSVLSIVENTSIVLHENNSLNITQQKKKSKLEPTGHKSFMKDKINSKPRESNRQKPSHMENKENETHPHLQEKIRHLQSTIKQASSQISKRDKQISELRENSTIDYKALYEQQCKKNLLLQNKLFEYESRCLSKVQQSVISNLKDQLCEVKFNIGKIINTADEFGGSYLVNELYSSIGIKEIAGDQVITNT